MSAPEAPPITARGRRRAERVRMFGRIYLRHWKDRYAGQPFVLEPWQWKNIVLPIYGTLDADGRRWYDRALVGLPRWNGKDELAALFACAHLIIEPVPSGEAYAVATSRRQAAILYDTVRDMLRRSPDLGQLVDTYKRELVVKDSGCVFRALPHDADTAQGFHPSLSVIDELHVHKSRAMLDAMLTGAVGRSEPLTIVITTAGAERRGVWWDVLHEWQDDPHAYVYWVGAKEEDDPTDRKVWRRANPASWVTLERLETLYHTLPLASFERYHLNRAPSKGTNRVFTPQLWRACNASPRIDADRPCVVAVDASLRRDHTAVVLDQVDSEGYHNLVCFTFKPEEDASIMRAVDHDEVGALLRDLATSYHVARMPCDRAYFVRTMRELLDEGLPVEEFIQGNQNMARACQRLYDVVSEGRVRHGGDRELEDHVLNAAVKETMYGWRMTKADEASKIDAAIAAAMAVDVAEAERETTGIGITVG